MLFKCNVFQTTLASAGEYVWWNNSRENLNQIEAGDLYFFQSETKIKTWIVSLWWKSQFLLHFNNPFAKYHFYVHRFICCVRSISICLIRLTRNDCMLAMCQMRVPFSYNRPPHTFVLDNAVFLILYPRFFLSEFYMCDKWIFARPRTHIFYVQYDLVSFIFGIMGHKKENRWICSV